MKEIKDREKFYKLLRENEQAALEELKENGEYIEKVKIGDLCYKIFTEIPEELFTEEESLENLPKGYAAFILCDVVFNEKIIERRKFEVWYFHGDAEFRDSTFSGDADFVCSTFNGNAYFGNSTFSGKANFTSSRFNGNADFEGSTLSGKANFTSSRFSGNAYSGNSTFNGNADFGNSTFKGNAYFGNSTFEGNAYFLGSTFNGNAYFGDSTFEGNADFGDSTFNGNADFGDSTFNSDTIFEGTTFKKCVCFWKSVFDEHANWREARFEKELFLNDAIFKERCDLRVKHFGNFIYFTGVEFRASLLIEGAKLCSNKPSEPDKLLLKNLSDDGVRVFKDKNKCTKDIFDSKAKLKESKDNLHTAKRIFHNLESYEDEDNIYYWYKVYEHKCEVADNTYKCCPNIKWQYKRVRLLLKKFLFDIVTGYFTKPLRTFSWAMFVLIICCLLYSLAAFKGSENIGYLRVANENGKMVSLSSMYKEKEGLAKAAYILGDTLYFSLITFTTVGYGDIQPCGVGVRILAGLEGLCGVFLMPVFIVTLAKKVLW